MDVASPARTHSEARHFDAAPPLVHAKSAPTLSHVLGGASAAVPRPSIRKEAFQQKRAAVNTQSRVLGKLSVHTAAQDAVRLALKPQQRVAYTDVAKEAEIGEGAFAVVFKGHWRGAAVAIKEIKYEEANETIVEDFCREVATMAALEHPCTVQFKGACMEPQHLLILLEYVAGGDAMLLLARDDVRLDWKRRLTWLLHISRALDYLHTLPTPIIHRDIKTENILVAPDMNSARLCDFGLAIPKSGSVSSLMDITSSSSPGASPTNSSASLPLLPVSKSAAAQRNIVPGLRKTSTVAMIRPHRSPQGSPGVVSGNSPTADANATASKSPVAATPNAVPPVSTPSTATPASSKTPAKSSRRRLSVDFGAIDLASLQRRKTSLMLFSQETGTPAYVAPEIWRCQPYSETVDVYSLAIVMFEVASREFAHDGMDNDEIIDAVRDGMVRPVLPTWCPLSLRLLVQDCWNDDPLYRPTAHEVVRRVKTLLLEAVRWPACPNELPIEQQPQELLEEEFIEEVYEEEYIEEATPHATPSAARLLPRVVDAEEQALVEEAVGIEGDDVPSDEDDELLLHMAEATRHDVSPGKGSAGAVVAPLSPTQPQAVAAPAVAVAVAVAERRVAEPIIVALESPLLARLPPEPPSPARERKDWWWSSADGAPTADEGQSSSPVAARSPSAASPAQGVFQMVSNMLMRRSNDGSAGAGAPSSPKGANNKSGGASSATAEAPKYSFERATDLLSRGADELLAMALPVDSVACVRFAAELSHNALRHCGERAAPVTDALCRRSCEAWDVVLHDSPHVLNVIAAAEASLHWCRHLLAHGDQLPGGYADAIVRLEELRAKLQRFAEQQRGALVFSLYSSEHVAQAHALQTQAAALRERCIAALIAENADLRVKLEAACKG